MKFTERKEFLYDADVFKRFDTQVALKIHAEYVIRHSANPRPIFFEVDRREGGIDHLWHMPQGSRTQFSRELHMPAINVFDKPSWRLTRIGIVPKRHDVFWLANLILQDTTNDPQLHSELESMGVKQLNYFPARGDMVYWNGYRYMIENVVIDPKSYWHQTNVWLGLVVECIIPPDGDAKPVINPGAAIPAEKAVPTRSGL